MLDIEVITPPEQDGLDIVSLAEMKKHLRVAHTAMDDDITEAIREAAETLHGLDGALNRMVFPCTLVRYLSAFPSGRSIQLPYPPLIQVLGIRYLGLDGESPDPEISASDYTVRTVDMIPEIVFNTTYEGCGPYPYWPIPAKHPRAIAVTYQAGYQEYPGQLKRLMKFLVGHYLENKEATINETRMLLVSRKVEYGVDHLMTRLRVPVAQDNWE